jgi:hypothetical protein
MSSPWKKKEPEAVADMVLRRAEVSKVRLRALLVLMKHTTDSWLCSLDGTQAAEPTRSRTLQGEEGLGGPRARHHRTEN